MADDKKKLYAESFSPKRRQQNTTTPTTGNLYGGSYDSQINDLYNQIANRPAFSYNVDGDALYQQYKDRYVQNAKLAMKDTMGQAAGLTGGYGSSYGQAVGQQAYDRQLQGLTDMIPTLEQSAYQKYQDAGNALRDRYSMLNAMGAAEQATNQAAYNQLAQLISTTGYTPTAADLDRAGMDSAQANALRQMWIASNPGAAYMAGQLSADDYFKLTGQYAPDVAAAMAAAAGGGGGTGGVDQSGGPGKMSAYDYGYYYAQMGASYGEVAKGLREAGYDDAESRAALYRMRKDPDLWPAKTKANDN